MTYTHAYDGNDTDRKRGDLPLQGNSVNLLIYNCREVFLILWVRLGNIP